MQAGGLQLCWRGFLFIILQSQIKQSLICMSGIDFDKLFSSFSTIKIGVVGDVMLDTYWWGKVERISPEAPVPVVSVTKREQRIEGAGNVALNLQSLGATVSILSVVGNDGDGLQLTDLLNRHSISTTYLVESNERVTTNKI